MGQILAIVLLVLLGWTIYKFATDKDAKRRRRRGILIIVGLVALILPFLVLAGG